MNTCFIILVQTPLLNMSVHLVSFVVQDLKTKPLAVPFTLHRGTLVETVIQIWARIYETPDGRVLMVHDNKPITPRMTLAEAQMKNGDFIFCITFPA